MKKLNYSKLMADNPTKYSEMVNQENQLIEFYEHPGLGDEYPVICVCNELKVAACSDFWDTSDFYKDSEYLPIYLHGNFECAYMFGY